MLVSIVTMTNNYPEIWDKFQTPDHVDRQNVIDLINMQCAELELLYSDPAALKMMIGIWTKTKLPIWEELQKTLEYKFNPIWNVEGSETMHIVRADDSKRDIVTSAKVSGYNSNDLAQRDEVEQGGTINNTGEETRTFTRGMNLGVRSTQELIREQREIVQFTVADYINASFKEQFTLMVY